MLEKGEVYNCSHGHPLILNTVNLSSLLVYSKWSFSYIFINLSLQTLLRRENLLHTVL